jgi:WD40 repeat protein
MRIIQCHVDPGWAKYGWPSHVRSVQFRTDGRELAAVIGSDAAARVAFYDLRRNVENKTIHARGDIEGEVFLVLSPDFGQLAHLGNERQGDKGGFHAVLSRRTGGKLVERNLGWWWGECITAMCFSPDGRHLAVTGWDAHDGFPGEGVAVWDVAAVGRARGRGEGGARWVGRQAAAVLRADDFLMSLAFSPDSATLAAGTANQGVLRWDVASGQSLPALPWTEPTGRTFMAQVGFSPDGKRLAAKVSWSGTKLILFDTVTATPRLVQADDGGPFAGAWANHFAFHPAGHILATVGRNGTLSFWDVDTGTQRQEFTWDDHTLYCLAFSPDGRTCAAGSDEGQIAIWDIDG